MALHLLSILFLPVAARPKFKPRLKHRTLLEQAYARISRDPRHQHLCKVADYPLAARQFTDWPLAFQSLSPVQFVHLASYLAPSKSAQHVSGYGSEATMFVEAMRARAAARWQLSAVSVSYLLGGLRTG